MLSIDMCLTLFLVAARHRCIDDTFRDVIGAPVDIAEDVAPVFSFPLSGVLNSADSR